MGRGVLSVVAFGEWRPRSEEGSTSSASFFEWAFSRGRPNLPNGGLLFPFSEAGLYSLEPPHTSPARWAGTFGDSMGGSLSGAKNIGGKLYANWGHASAQQFGRARADSDGWDVHWGIALAECW